MLWTLFILFEIRAFMVARTTTMWYHAPSGSPVQGSPVYDSLKLAVGPASGSLVMGGAVLTVAEILRMIANAVQSEENGVRDLLPDFRVAANADFSLSLALCASSKCVFPAY